MFSMLVKSAVVMMLTAIIPVLLTPPVLAQSCVQDGAGAKPQDPAPPKDHWAYDAIAELAAKGIIEGYPDGTFRGTRAMTRHELAIVSLRPSRDMILGEILDALLESPGAVDTDSDGKKDTYVAKADGKWFGVTDITRDGQVDYVWNDQNGDGLPQPGELRKLNRCWEEVIVPVRPTKDFEVPQDLRREPEEKNTQQPGR